MIFGKSRSFGILQELRYFAEASVILSPKLRSISPKLRYFCRCFGKIPKLRLKQELRYPAEASASDSAEASAPAEAEKVRSGPSLRISSVVRLVVIDKIDYIVQNAWKLLKLQICGPSMDAETLAHQS